MESGADVRYIQTLLGHVSVKTTERYTHVARRSVLRIQSPLDAPLDSWPASVLPPAPRV